MTLIALILSTTEQLKALIYYDGPMDFMAPFKRANESLRPSLENARFIETHHTIERFSNYIAGFLGEQTA